MFCDASWNLVSCDITENTKLASITNGNSFIIVLFWTLIGLIIDILKNKDNENKVDLVEFINSEIKKRSIKGSVKYYEDKSDKLLVEYYNIKYIVEIDKICKN